MKRLEIDKYGRPLPPQPFKFYYDGEGVKSRGYDYQKNKFYFNDIASPDFTVAQVRLSEMMFGRSKNV